MTSTTISPQSSLSAESEPRAADLVTKSPLAGTVMLVTLSAMATIWLTFAGIKIEGAYLHNYGFFFDPAAYYLHNIEVYRHYESQGILSTLAHQIAHNPRDPARIVPHLLFAPQSLISLWGHMWTQMPLVFAFLSLLSTTTWARTRSLLLSCAAIASFASMPFLYDPMHGVAAYWLDFTPACALGCLALCLVRFLMRPHLGWMFFFGIFASLAALNRWSSSFYVIAFAALAFPLALTAQNRSQSIVKCVLVAFLGAAPGLLFLFGFWQENSWYYKTFGFAFGAPISQSVLWTSKAIVKMIGAPLLCTILAMSLLHLKRLKQEARVIALCWWLPISILLFVCCVVKAVDGYHPLVYFGPALAVSAFGALRTPSELTGKWLGATVAILVLCLAVGVHSYEVARKIAHNPSPEETLKKKADAALAGLIIETNSRCFTEFDTESVRPQMEVFFFHKRFCNWVSYFSIHESYLKFIYDNATPPQMADRAFKQLKNKVELVAVFANASDALKPGVFNNQYSAAVSKGVAEQVATDPDFHLTGHVQAPAGLLAVYKNNAYKTLGTTLNPK